MFKTATLKIFLLFLLCVLFVHNLRAQHEGEDTTIYVYESLNDSIDLASEYFDLTDSLGYIFFSEYFGGDKSDLTPDSLAMNMENWNNDLLFFNRTFNPANMVDSVYIILQDSARFFVPPFMNYTTSKFGWRRRHFHYGIDIKLEVGDPVRSAFDGVVRVAKMGWGGGYGNVIVVRHYNGLETLYGHLSELSVTPNQQVKAGDIIGLGGNTGRSYGSHLHFETRYLGVPINPEYFIDFSTHRLKKDSLYLSKSSFNYVTDIKKVAGSFKYYKVKNGDSLSRIAVKNRTTVNAICRLNGIKPSKVLRVGQVIRVR